MLGLATRATNHWEIRNLCAADRVVCLVDRAASLNALNASLFWPAATGPAVLADRSSALSLLPCLSPPARERERASLETCADVSEPALTAWRSPRHGAPGGDPNEYRTCAVRALLPSVHDGTAVGPAPTPGFRTARHRAPCAPSGASQCPRGLPSEIVYRAWGARPGSR
jgi:hypothetical protein